MLFRSCGGQEVARVCCAVRRGTTTFPTLCCPRIASPLPVVAAMALGFVVCWMAFRLGSADGGFPFFPFSLFPFLLLRRRAAAKIFLGFCTVAISKNGASSFSGRTPRQRGVRGSGHHRGAVFTPLRCPITRGILSPQTMRTLMRRERRAPVRGAFVSGIPHSGVRDNVLAPRRAIHRTRFTRRCG